MNDENMLYNIVAKEIESNLFDKGLMARCFAECEGDKLKSVALYTKLRVQQLKKDEERKQSEQEINEFKGITRKEAIQRWRANPSDKRTWGKIVGLWEKANNK